MTPEVVVQFGRETLVTALLLAMITALERFITAGCLGGTFKPVDNLISTLADKLPF